jgi:D-beta-D-heptose 7-phosphate kinase/D-beta-D-heptose 1-phosphate adenosyltransferase
LQQSLLDWTKTILPEVALCVFSDYAKGISTPEFMQEFMELAAEYQRPVIVDPKGNGFQKYRGAVLITPNLQEMEIATGMEIHSDTDLLAAYQMIHERLPGTNILIKMGSHGMTLFRSSGEPYHVEAEARQVFDVTGAGDTVIATFAMALAAGADLNESTLLANRAAGIVVAKVGTASVTTNELLHLSTV